MTNTARIRKIGLPLLAGFVALLGSIPAGRADIVYHVHLDTANVIGTEANLQLQFNPGNADALDASVYLSNVQLDGTLTASAATTGAATGMLPGQAFIQNTRSLNDILQGIVLGKSLRFDATLSGPALSPPSPPRSGSTFAVSLYDAHTGAPLLTNHASGSILQIRIMADGTTETRVFPSGDDALSAATITPGSVPTLRGDLDANGVVNMLDVVRLLRISGGLQASVAGHMGVADLDGDGLLSQADALWLLRLLGQDRGGRVTRNTANGFSTYGVVLDDPYLNGRPAARVMASHQYVAAHNPSPLGVFYHSLLGRWIVYNEDRSPMPDGEAFHYGYSSRIQTAVHGAQDFAFATRLNDPTIAGRPSANLLAIHHRAAGKPDSPSPLGVLFATSDRNWHALNEDFSGQADGQEFFFLDPGVNGGRAVRSASTAYYQHGVLLDDPRLNGNPNAVVIAQHGYQDNAVLAPVGVVYDSNIQRWVAFRDDAQTMPDGEAIHYWVVSP